MPFLLHKRKSGSNLSVHREEIDWVRKYSVSPGHDDTIHEECEEAKTPDRCGWRGLTVRHLVSA